MSALLLLTSALQPSAEVLPGLALLSHTVKIVPAQGSALLDAPESDLVLVDGRQDLAVARDLCRLIRTTGADAPVLLIVTEGGLAVVGHDWGTDDVVLHTCGPAELDARIRLAIGRTSAAAPDDPTAHVIHRGEVVVDDATYTARIGGRPLDLTYKEFELLKYLAQHPGRVFSREQLLQEVWGYDYFGGTRTVDVHVRRLRAKLGTEHEHHIGTVRNVGYRFVVPDARPEPRGRGGRRRRPRSSPRSADWRRSLGEGPRDMSGTTFPGELVHSRGGRTGWARRRPGKTYVMRLDAVSDLLARQDGVVSRSQLLAAPLTQAQVDTLLRRREPRRASIPASTSPTPGRPRGPQRCWAAVLYAGRSALHLGVGAAPARHRRRAAGSDPRGGGLDPAGGAAARRPRPPRAPALESKVQWNLSPPARPPRGGGRGGGAPGAATTSQQSLPWPRWSGRGARWPADSADRGRATRPTASARPC